MGEIKKILIPGKVPSPTSFQKDDIVINPLDGKIYIKSNQNIISRVINQDSDKDTLLDGNVLIDKTIEFKESKNSNSILFISSSEDNPRVGIGTTTPKSTLDFKSIENSTTGTELILRSARTTNVGALNGDEGGSINFTIDSGSFNDLKTSGSLAKIKTIVNSVGVGGAQGVLAFTISKGAGAEGIDAFQYGYTIGGESAAFAQVQTGSLIITDLSALSPSTIKMVDFDGTLHFQVFEGNITSSGNISCSGDIIGNINGGVF